MTEPPNPLNALGEAACKAAFVLALAPTERKNAALRAMAEALGTHEADILAANERDVQNARKNNLPEPQIDRLRLNAARLRAMAESVAAIAALPDPVGRSLGDVTRPNGLRIEKRAVPLGVVGIIFESRPNVAVDAAALCIKSGNACLLRGGSDGWQSVQTLLGLVRDALQTAGLPREAAQSLPSPDRELVGAFLALDAYVDVMIPRGGKSLTARVQKESRMPVLSHLEGICHTYIDAKADRNKAVEVTVNAKMRRTSICGATECLLLHKDIASTIGREVLVELVKAGCEVRVPNELLAYDPALKLASPEDYGREFLAPVIAVAVVDDLDGAIRFVNRHGSRHTDAIITEDAAAAERFMTRVGSAIAMHNASTQFADGGEFGKGAEIGIATGKLHARGPVGLEELTTYQYRVRGDGQTRL